MVLTLVLNKFMALIGLGKSRQKGAVHPVFMTSLEDAATDDEKWSEQCGGVPPFIAILLSWLEAEPQRPHNTVMIWRLLDLTEKDEAADPDFAPAVKILTEPGSSAEKWQNLLGLVRVETSLLLFRKYLREMEGGLRPRHIARQLARAKGDHHETLTVLQRDATPSLAVRHNRFCVSAQHTALRCENLQRRQVMQTC